MKITQVDHITINMSQPEKSFEFYGNILGLEKIEEVDMGDHILYYYQLPGTRLELIAYKTSQTRIQSSNTDTGIYRHFAVCVDDLEEGKKRCEKAGYGINLYPKRIGEIQKTVMLIKDPNGVEIELIQR